MSHRNVVGRVSTGYVAAFALAILGICLLTLNVSRDVSTAPSATLADVRPRRASPESTTDLPDARVNAPASPPIEPLDRWQADRDRAERPTPALRFRLSGSVMDACGMHELWNDCSKLNGFLERMRAEPRDVDWAPAAEARIERAVYEGERGQYRIRALECHSTRCVLEVVSESRTNGIAYAAAHDDGLTEDVGAVASENDPQTGIRTQVFVQIWQKRDDVLSSTHLDR
jgi:hypothetical protein